MRDDLRRIAEALERLAPPPAPLPELSGEAFLWAPDRLVPVERVARVDLGPVSYTHLTLPTTTDV